LREKRPRLSQIGSNPTTTGAFGSFDVVGDIAIFRGRGVHCGTSKKYARLILSTHKGLKTVLRQDSSVSGEFRLRKLTYFAGENRTRTVHKESGCSFAVDLQSCYFSPRLSFERSRIAQMVTFGESVINMFAGVGCFSIIIAKTVKSSKVFSIDINPSAFEFQRQNINSNGVYSRVVPILGDSEKVVETNLLGSADRVLMPLPEKAFEFLNCAVSALKPHGGWIHYYDFVHAKTKEDPVEKTMLKVGKRLTQLDLKFNIPFSRIVRSTGPNWFQVILDIHIQPSQDKS
jgi:tRNA (guanine37-N1)-methyltransferase